MKDLSIVSTMGFLRLPQIIGDPKAEPPIQGLIPVGRSTWWRWVREGKAPAAVKLGTRTTAWRTEEILAFISSLCDKKTTLGNLTSENKNP